jgi:GNAT superfamily N-acetyltransferase
VPKEINCLFSWLIISVDESFTRRGIARQLLEYREDELKDIGCQGFVTTASAYNSQQV